MGGACLTSGGEAKGWLGPWMGRPSAGAPACFLPLCQCPQVIPQGVPPSPCIPCCLVITDDRLFTCHEDCQTSFFRSLGTAALADISAVSTEPGREYCVLVSPVGGAGGRPTAGALCWLTGPRSPQEFSRDGQQPLPPWVIYLSCTSELDRFLSALNSGWRTIYQVPSCPGLSGASRSLQRGALPGTDQGRGWGPGDSTGPVALGQTGTLGPKGNPDSQGV